MLRHLRFVLFICLSAFLASAMVGCDGAAKTSKKEDKDKNALKPGDPKTSPP